MGRVIVILVGLLLVRDGDVCCVYGADKAKAVARPATATYVAPGKKITAVGTVEPAQVVEVGTQVAGKIVSLGADPRVPGRSIDYGSSVEAGTVLAQMDSDLQRARVERGRAACSRAEAELAQAAVRLEHAELHWKQTQERKKGEVLSDSDFQRARFDYKLAKAAVTVAEAVLRQGKAALRQAEIELSYTTIKSPIQGVVIDRRVSVGQTVAPANAPGLFLVAKVDRLQVWASVKEADIVRVHKQQAVRFTVDACPGKVFEGKVEQIRMNATLMQNVVTYTVVVAISSTATGLLPYLTAHLEFQD